MPGSSRTTVVAGQTSPFYDADFYPFGGERADSSSEKTFRPLQGKGIGHPRCVLQVDNLRLV
jgi:hypothetical protein